VAARDEEGVGTCAVDFAMSARPNWFIGFEVDLREHLAKIPSPPRGIRRFHADDLHATIAFLGPCDEALALRAFAALPDALGPATTVVLGGVVPMGRRDAYSALAALVEEGREPLERRMTSWRDVALAAADRPPETRAMKAHVTLARPTRRASEAERRAGLAWASTVDVYGAHIALQRVRLYTWSEERAERLFRAVCERELGAG
jgi:2'-5' RNA ligase